MVYTYTLAYTIIIEVDQLKLTNKVLFLLRKNNLYIKNTVQSRHGLMGGGGRDISPNIYGGDDDANVNMPPATQHYIKI